MSKFTAEFKRIEGHENHTVILRKDGEAFLNHGYTGSREAALKLAIERRKSLVEETQRKLVRAQVDAMIAREMLEAVEKLSGDVTPRGWGSVQV